MLGAFPFKTSVVVGLLCFVAIRNPPLAVSLGFSPEHIKEAEFYPLSSFPMYSKFSPNPTYLYLTDTANRPIACETALGVRASIIKKIYDREVRVVGRRAGTPISKLSRPLKQEAGLATLRVLREDVARERIAAWEPGPLRLHEVVIRRGKDGAIEETTTFVGEL